MIGKGLALPQITQGEINNPPQTATVFLDSNDGQVKAKIADGSIQTFGGAGAVSSVFTRTGAVVAQSGDYTKAQVGLSNVDNTSDANKPVSTATQTALNLKQNLIPKGMTVIDYSNIQDDSNITTIPELTFAAAANKNYLVEIFARVHTAAAAAGVIRIKPSYPAGITSAYVGVGGPLASGSNITSQPPTDGMLMAQYQSANNSDFTPAWIFIDVTTGASAGNITFGFSGGNGPTATSILAGSKMRVTEF